MTKKNTQRREGMWIDLFPFDKDKGLVVLAPNHDFELRNPDLAADASRVLANIRKKGWANGIIPTISKLTRDKEGTAVSTGTIRYNQAQAINEANSSARPYAPADNRNTSLSASYVVVTNDGMIFYRTRDGASDIHCRGMNITEPSGYLSSLSLGDPENPSHTRSSRLVNLVGQTETQMAKFAKSIGIDSSRISYDATMQDGMGSGFGTKEMYFLGTARAKVNSFDIDKSSGIKTFPIDAVPDLLRNQGRLVHTHPDNLDKNDPREIPLLDESIAGLLLGYQEITGNSLDLGEMVNHLNKTGLDIVVNTDKEVKFPTSF